MGDLLPDLGTLLLILTLLLTGLILVFETLERRREVRSRERYLDDIAREYADYQRLGWF